MPSLRHLILALVVSPLAGGTWNYNFVTGGIDANYWSTSTPSGGAFTFTHSAGVGVITATAGTDTSFRTGKLDLSLNQFPSITDFSMSATFTGGQLSGGVHQIQLEMVGGPGILLDRSNQASVGSAGGNSVNVFDGSSVLGFTTLSGADALAGVSTPGTLTLTRAGTTYTGYWNGNQFWTGTYSASPLTEVHLALNNNYGATDATQVTWQSFSLSASAIPEPSTYAFLAGLLALAAAARRRSSCRR